MNWKIRTKLLALAGLILANLLVLIGSLIIVKTGASSGSALLWVQMVLWDALFLWFVFLLPAIQNRSKKL
jgi:hypothetical protein